MKIIFESTKSSIDFVSKFKELREYCEDNETENIIKKFGWL